MKYLFLSLLLGIGLLGTVGCSGWPNPTQEPFTYQNIPVTSDSASTGEGSTILFRGSPLPLSGQAIHSGESLRSVKVARSDLSLLDVQDTRGQVRIISVVPSLDTKVCEQQTHYLSEKNQGLDQQVRLITISVDTPFAQQRFAKEAKISNVEFLSDYRGGQFGQAHGVLLEGPHLLSRGIMVVDPQNVIRHLQITPNLGHMPDMEKAFEVARSLIN